VNLADIVQCPLLDEILVRSTPTQADKVWLKDRNVAKELVKGVVGLGRYDDWWVFAGHVT
jgi:hypothetical protein